MLHNQPIHSALPAFFSEKDISIEQFGEICAQIARIEDYPLAERVEKNIVIYSGDNMREALNSPETEAALKAELTHCLKDGPGVFAVTGAYPDTHVIDKSTTVFNEIIAAEKAAGQGQGDHFGSNERIWNSLQKVAVHAPQVFIDYYGNPILALACQAWLGPHYQITAQVNNVKPGSKAQSAHRDYHLGFQSDETVAQFPAHAQVISQYLTLQGAIAHTDMPLETGPTLLLPFSQQFLPGYMAYRKPTFVAYFEQHNVQLPLQKGDAVFFSPALFHGAGTNQSQGDRLANLVQISSAFGRPMETVNRNAMIEAVYPTLLEQVKAGNLAERKLSDTIAALGDGYSFPTNLDSDPPIGGNAPETGQQILRKALEGHWPLNQVQDVLYAYAKRREA